VSGDKCKFKNQHFAAKNLVVFKWAYFAYTIAFLIWGFVKDIATMKDVRDMGISIVIVFLGHMGHNTYLKHLVEKNGGKST
jgi:hypothetical protein